MSEHVGAPSETAHAELATALSSRERARISRGIGWPAAVAIGIAVSVFLAVVLLYVPHWMLTRLPFLTRSVRVALATTWMGAVTVALLWAGVRFGRAPVPTR